MTNRSLLAAYDVRDGSYDPKIHEPFRAWCGEQGINVNVAVRVEIHKTDRLFARVTEHDLDDEGKPTIDDAGTGIRLRVRDARVACHPPQAPVPVGQ